MRRRSAMNLVFSARVTASVRDSFIATKAGIKVFRTPYAYALHHDSGRLRRTLCVAQGECRGTIVTLHDQLTYERDHTRDISARPDQTRREFELHRVTAGYHDDRDRPGCLFGREYCFTTGGHNDVDLRIDEFSSHAWKSDRLPLSPPRLKDDVLFTQPLTKCLPPGGVGGVSNRLIEKPDPHRLPHLLRLGDER
jgi:hypothetical protein